MPFFSNSSKKNLLFKVPMTKNNLFPLHLDGGQHAFKASLDDQNWLWHYRYGHLNFRSLYDLSNKNLVEGIPQIKGSGEICESFIFGKQHREDFPKGKTRRVTRPIELVHADVCGPMRIPSLNNNIYFIVFVDDYSRFTWIYFAKEKSEAVPFFKKFKSCVEKQSGHTLKILRTDLGGEFLSKEFDSFCVEFGI